MYRIEYAQSVGRDLARLRAFDRARILDRIEEVTDYEVPEFGTEDEVAFLEVGP